MRICNFQCKCDYLTNANLFLNCLFHFGNLHHIWNILKKNMMVIANAFAKLQTVKNFLRPFCKKRRLGTRFHSQHVKVSQNLAKSPWEHFYNGFWSFWEKLIWKISPLVLPEILGVFLTTLTAEGKYSIEDWEKLPLLIQMELSEKRKAFPEFAVQFVESTSNFKYFEKKLWWLSLMYFWN